MSIGGFVVLATLGIFNAWVYFWSDPASVLKWAVLYVAIGVVWMVAKWWRFCVVRKNEWDGLSDRDKELAIRTSFGEGVRPHPQRNKERLITWMSLWPFSVIGTFIGDFLMRFWDWVYDRCANLLDAISKSVWGDVQ